MKRLTLTLAIILALTMSSCVYSLFPIYTAETLTYWPELAGKWQLDDGMLQFSSMSGGGSIKIDVNPGEDEFIIEDGDTIRDRERIKAYYENDLKSTLEARLPQLSEKGYLMKIIDDQDTVLFQARLAAIGNSHFLDLYPMEANNYISENFFPVHTFMKIQLENNMLELTQFDMSKLKDLFKSNKIRLRHEKVNDAIMITANPDEIQKFLKAYAKDESVFEHTDTYQKVNS